MEWTAFIEHFSLYSINYDDSDFVIVTLKSHREEI